MDARQRGFALIEMLVVSVIGAMVILAIGTMYWHSARAWSQSQARAALQRQGTLVQEEMARVILPASGILAGPCGPSGGVSIGVQIPAGALPDPGLSNGGFVCFYWEGNVDPKLWECRLQSATNRTCLPGTTRNLLVGAPVPETIEAPEVRFPLTAGRMVEVDFQIRARRGQSVVAGPMRFSTYLTIRN